MIIIVGLGNPGEKFNRTPHNAGFEALDFFAAKNGFPEFKLSERYKAEISEKDGVMLAKPQTFMNESGRSAAALLKNSNAELVVVHDDIDIALGNIKIVQTGGTGGHKGVASIIEALGTKDFTRIKIGVEIDPTHKAEDVVLKKFSPEEYKKLEAVFPQIAEALQTIIAA